MSRPNLSFILLFMLFSVQVYASENTASPAEVLSEIQVSQDTISFDQIDCNKVSERQFEELGDALMEQMHPGEVHEAMDAMMGGEGSESSKAIHVSMGRSYLRCNGVITGSPMMQASAWRGMMQGALGPGMMQSITGNWQTSQYFDYNVLWIIIALLIVSIGLNLYLVFKVKEGKK